MKKIILLFAFCLLLFITPVYVVAQTTPTPTSTERLQQIKERVEERIQEIKEKVQTKAFWGTLKEVTNSTLVIDTSRGERRVKITEETKISLDKKTVKASDLGIGNFLIVIGSTDNNENFVATRIMAFSKTPKSTPQRQAIFGKVSDISLDEKVLTVTHPKKVGVTYEVKVTDKTVITKKVEEKIKKVNFEAIEIGDRVVCVAIKDKDTNSFTAKIIHVIPGKATGLEKQVSPTPTPKVKISPTPTPKKPTPTPTE